MLRDQVIEIINLLLNKLCAVCGAFYTWCMSKDESTKLFRYMSKRFDVIEKRLDQTVSKDEHNSIVVRLEDIQDKLKGLAEAMAGLITKVNVMDRRLEKVEEDTSLMLPILKVAVKDQTKRLTL